ncbi:hypothetical protein [Corynebacterium cystitidis]|uniref:Uncharacterized protein n=1 Tax=Corynebacterium cystitidis DSM 20524 TaxID=1121357 RepID=A0A1H9WMK5_9CORY|nr:hypothetical protein [Corynebacterium cystitidis]WJY82831.1 hypothetical protein CCYS_09585 [Corynebacterium cystitidis DSM 20524]SES35142.1 hypothetical protein SAMN05661109_02820 [Corynebacterium cystitidis DSM 20524]SNV70051.1 Uncharacterised protein [Corynebacterium cystitidis]
MNYRPLNPQQREMLLEKARSYRPRHNPVSDEVLAVMRQVLIAGVEVHGLDTLVRGIADDKKLSTVGGMLARYIPAMMVLGSEPSDLDDLFDGDRIAWWEVLVRGLILQQPGETGTCCATCRSGCLMILLLPG